MPASHMHPTHDRIIHTYVYTHTHTHTHTYASKSPRRSFELCLYKDTHTHTHRRERMDAPRLDVELHAHRH